MSARCRELSFSIFTENSTHATHATFRCRELSFSIFTENATHATHATFRCRELSFSIFTENATHATHATFRLLAPSILSWNCSIFLCDLALQRAQILHLHGELHARDARNV
ncbi:hypothetical protein PF008_g4384 [Phytophthora fragariae]|uniref:C2H2-type domain-containing protein n=1 Tax=Phytophthora fragariae TaxID=53985 RepID=A0A6G0SBF0_9STRA|nr:hypothetical protein PF008_g4384 [Phytophthora fragariae]